MDWAVVNEAVPFLLREVKRAGLEWAIAAGLGLHCPDAVLVIILDRVASRLECLVGPGIAHDDVLLADVIEESVEPLLEQRQPMLHAAHPAAVGNRLIERI